MRSLSEIETTSKRASRAMGFSWGIAEEIAKGVRLLELYGLPGIKNLNEYFLNKEKIIFEKLVLIDKKNELEKSSTCPIILGVSFLDQIKKIEILKRCIFKEISYPLLFLPFLSRSSGIIGKKILLKFNTTEFLLNFNINISSNLINENFPSVAKEVEVIFLENKDSFSEIEWKNLYRLSENTFVEETDSLKQEAAGAGLTDND